MRLLQLLMALCLLSSAFPSQASVAPPRLDTPSASLSLRLQVQDLCANFELVCDFAAKNCDPQATDLSPKCVESFNLFYQHNKTLSSCIQEFPVDSGAKAQALVFLEFYTAWQQEHACELFRETEAKAARECSGSNAHRPWKQTTWPLYCHEVFAMYNTSRHELEQLCGRSPNSEALWEGYANYIAPKTCKQYYDMIREARERGCGDEEKALHGAECREMFQWYLDRQKVVETDCFELQASKAFYRGFYTWKKRQP
jgi:hypothetical protein